MTFSLVCIFNCVSAYLSIFLSFNLFLYFSIFISCGYSLVFFLPCLNLFFLFLLSSSFQSYYLISTLHQHHCVCPLFFSCECEYVCVSVCICMSVCLVPVYHKGCLDASISVFSESIIFLSLAWFISTMEYYSAI